MSTLHTPCEDLELETASLERLAFEYRNCHCQETLNAIRAEFQRRDANAVALPAPARRDKERGGPMKETVLVRIEQKIGGTHRCTQCLSDEETTDESQQKIGFAVGQAVRGILAQQNCGSSPLFWIGFLKEIQYTDAGGEWAQSLLRAVEKWWEESAESSVSFSDSIGMFD